MNKRNESDKEAEVPQPIKINFGNFNNRYKAEKQLEGAIQLVHSILLFTHIKLTPTERKDFETTMACLKRIECV